MGMEYEAMYWNKEENFLLKVDDAIGDMSQRITQDMSVDIQ